MNNIWQFLLCFFFYVLCNCALICCEIASNCVLWCTTCAKCHIIQIKNNIFNFPFIFKHFRNLRELSPTLEYKCIPGKQHPNLWRECDRPEAKLSYFLLLLAWLCRVASSNYSLHASYICTQNYYTTIWYSGTSIQLWNRKM